MKSIKLISGKGLFIKGANIDTDQIIPARFLKSTSFAELAQGLFYDQRYTEEGTAKAHPLNQKDHGDILFTEDNFGCGSSREHAPQALQKAGFKAVVGISFGPIFRSNCYQIGLPCFTIDAADLRLVVDEFFEPQSSNNVRIDIEKMTLFCGPKQVPITTTDGERQSLLEGTYDPLALLLANKEKIRELAARTELV